MATTDPQPFVRIFKTNPGFMPAPPLPAMNPAQMPPDIETLLSGDAPPPGVGVVPPAVLPFINNHDDRFSQAEIGYLCRWYNDDFNIVAGDRHLTQLRKLKAFLLGE